MRTLYYIHALHTAEESESEAGPAPTPGSAKARQWARDGTMLRDCWKRVLRRIDQLIAQGTIPRDRLHLFSDGVPRLATSPYSKVRSSVPSSPTFKFLLDMVERGAIAHGTEDPALLLMQIITSDQRLNVSAYRRRKTKMAVLRDRDEFVAEVINDDVPDGHSAICVMGALHRVDLLVKAADRSWRIVHLKNFLRLMTPSERRRLTRARHTNNPR